MSTIHTNTLSALDRVTVPCPVWCTLGAGHPYDDTTHDGGPIRVHEVDAGAVVLSSGRRVSAAVDASETVTADGRVTLGPIVANVFDGGNLSDLTQDDLGRLVGFLAIVAAQLRRVEAVEAAADLVQEVQA